MLNPIAVASLALSIGIGGAQTSAAAQSGGDLTGIWVMTSSTLNRAGVVEKPFGTNPRGRLILDASGNYILAILSPGLPQFRSNNRTTGTSDENSAVVRGTISHFGTYVVADTALVFNIEASTFPNWDGKQQKRPFRVTGDELSFTVPASSIGGVALVTFKRTK